MYTIIGAAREHNPTYRVFQLLCTYSPLYNDLTTVPYIGDDSMHQRLFGTTALPDDGQVRPET